MCSVFKKTTYYAILERKYGAYCAENQVFPKVARFIKPRMNFNRLGCRKRGGKIVHDEEIRNLLQSYVENGTMDPKAARMLLDRILKILFQPDSS